MLKFLSDKTLVMIYLDIKKHKNTNVVLCDILNEITNRMSPEKFEELKNAVKYGRGFYVC